MDRPLAQAAKSGGTAACDGPRSRARALPPSTGRWRAVPAAGPLTRTFGLIHDCVHCSSFASHRANTVLGHLCGTLVFTPLKDWRVTRLRHHASYGNLDAGGVGDIATLTVSEYLAEHCPGPTRVARRPAERGFPSATQAFRPPAPNATVSKVPPSPAAELDPAT